MLFEPAFEGTSVILMIGLMLAIVTTQPSLLLAITTVLMIHCLQPLVKNPDAFRAMLIGADSSLTSILKRDKTTGLVGQLGAENLEHG